jgi:hypothetical protein
MEKLIKKAFQKLLNQHFLGLNSKSIQANELLPEIV